MAEAQHLKHLTPKFKKVSRQAETQTLKANATPRIGQGTRKSRSAYHQATGQAKSYAGASASYNVGRTRRADHKS
jgi:hypothetical protein